MDAEAQAERNGARVLYRLSLWSPLLSVIGLVVFAPFVIPVLLFTGYRSRHAFVRWHTAQWMLLTLAALCVGVNGWHSNVRLIPIAFGSWWIGNAIALRQVNHGDCWLWRWQDDTAPLPRSWALTPDAAPTLAGFAPLRAPDETLPKPPAAAPASNVPVDAQAAFVQGMALARQRQQDQAAACFMTAYREGSPFLRRRAVGELEKLGEVEVF